MNPWPISPLTAKDLDFAIVNYDFSALTAEELGPTDGILPAIDSLLADFGQSITDQTLLIASMADDLDDLPVILNELAATDLDQLLADLAGIAATGDGLLSNFTTAAG